MSAITDQRYECFLCGKVCRSGAGLDSHLRSWAHADEFACPLCEGGTGPACSWHFL